MKITIVAGARPNFMKIAPIIKELNHLKKKGNNVEYRLIHTGQHYDPKMSSEFFLQLGIPHPDINLECGGGSQAEQTAAIMIKFEKELINNKPDIVIVVGDVTSSMACAITAKKLCIDVAHVEAGIRSGDMNMPEEINRMVTDSISDYFFTTTTTASNNLESENIMANRIHLVGNTMIDTLIQNIEKIRRPSFLKENEHYFLLTLHRPSNVDNISNLDTLLSAISQFTKDISVIFPVHPRTKNIIDSKKLSYKNIIMVDPQGYLEFIYLIKNSKGIITDSGGITEEATYLHIPCLTMRNTTERPETVTIGTNELIGNDLVKLKKYIQQIIDNKWKQGSVPIFWDGKTSKRIVQKINSIYKDEIIKKEYNILMNEPAV